MEYINLALGIVLIIAFTWIFVKNSKRTSMLHALIRIDTMIGIIAGLFLIVSSVLTLLFRHPA